MTKQVKHIRKSKRGKLFRAGSNKIKIGSKKFNELMKEKRFGIIVMGAGKPLVGWIEGIDKMLKEEGIVNNINVFEDAYVLSDNVLGVEGRTDLVLIFNEKAKIQIGKLAMWRIRFGSVSWIDDFINNYPEDYLSAPQKFEDDER